MNWYLLQTKPNAHHLAFENLKRQGFEVFLPLIVKTSKKGSRFVNKTVPLFSNYIFMGTKKESISWRSINATRGISKAVTLDGTYRHVNNHIIAGIKSRCNKNGIIQIMDDIASGDRVKIERGPFSDFICNVDKIVDSQRALVLVDILQQETRAKVSLNNLSKIC